MARGRQEEQTNNRGMRREHTTLPGGPVDEIDATNLSQHKRMEIEKKIEVYRREKD